MNKAKKIKKAKRTISAEQKNGHHIIKIEIDSEGFFDYKLSEEAPTQLQAILGLQEKIRIKYEETKRQRYFFQAQEYHLRKAKERAEFLLKSIQTPYIFKCQCGHKFDSSRRNARCENCDKKITASYEITIQKDGTLIAKQTKRNLVSYQEKSKEEKIKENNKQNIKKAKKKHAAKQNNPSKT